ncbi:hypothetical protein FKM82_025939 [Ascaphus truei]
MHNVSAEILCTIRCIFRSSVSQSSWSYPALLYNAGLGRGFAMRKCGGMWNSFCFLSIWVKTCCIGQCVKMSIFGHLPVYRRCCTV